MLDAAVWTLSAPIFPIALTLIYYDQRVRKEGYDIELLMAEAGMDAALAGRKAPGSTVS